MASRRRYVRRPATRRRPRRSRGIRRYRRTRRVRRRRTRRTRRYGFRRSSRGVTLFRNPFGRYGSILPSRYSTKLSYRGETLCSLIGQNGGTNLINGVASPLYVWAWRGTRPSDPTYLLSQLAAAQALSYYPTVGYTVPLPTTPTSGSAYQQFPNHSVANWNADTGLGRYYYSAKVWGVKSIFGCRFSAQNADSDLANVRVYLGQIAVSYTYVSEVTGRLAALQVGLAVGANVDVRGALKEFPFHRVSVATLHKGCSVSMYTTTNGVNSRSPREPLPLEMDVLGLQAPANDFSQYIIISYVLVEGKVAVNLELSASLTYRVTCFQRRYGIGRGENNWSGYGAEFTDDAEEPYSGDGAQATGAHPDPFIPTYPEEP